MNKFEEIRKEVEMYLMERFKYRQPFVYLTISNVVATRQRVKIDLYLRICRIKGLFPHDCLIIARIGFREERIGHGTHFVHFLTKIAVKYGFKHIGIESTNEKSKEFAEKLGFHSIDGSNYVATTDSLIEYFQN